MIGLTTVRRTAPLASILLLAACDSGQKGQAAAPPPAPSVEVVTVAKRAINPSSSFNGRVEAVDKVDLRARVAGFLQTIAFTEGAEVKTGDPLFSIEKQQYQAALLQAQAAVKEAEASLTNAQLQLDRGQQLSRNNNIPQSEVDTRRAQRDGSQGQLLAAQAQQQQAEINLGYTDVSAPIGGKIGAKTYSVGSFVNTSSGTLATIVSQDPMYVTFPVSSRQLLEVRRSAAERGQDPSHVQVRIRLPDGSTYDQVGSINFVDVQVSSTTDTVTIRAGIPNPSRSLIDGQLVGVIVEAAEAQQALLVPQAALLADQAGPYVLSVGSDSKVEQRRVSLGDAEGTDIVVKDGLKDGERVIVEGLQKVRPGQAVEVAESAKPAGA